MQYALFSLSEKEGAVELAQFLCEQGLALMASSSTAAFLKDAGLEVQNVSDFTGSPEILDGRVKTLHPKIHGSLLYLRDKHQAEQLRSELRDIAVVVVNLYPFAQTLAKSAVKTEELIEKIDIGGPAMLRSAAKNYQSISVLCQTSDYAGFMAEWREQGQVCLKTRRKLAAKVYAHTAHYDALISNWLNQMDGELFPEKLIITGERRQLTRYGENPHQSAAIYNTPNLASHYAQLHGKEMSYNNFLDAEAALGFLRLFSEKAAIIIKHQNPCGSAIACNPEEPLLNIYKRALSCDTVSAFGGILALNGPVELVLAEQIAQTFYEIILAPSYSPEALKRLQSKKNLRILQNSKMGSPTLDFRALSTGFAIQQFDDSLFAGDKVLQTKELQDMQCVTERKPEARDLRELSFAWKIASRTKSNAIVLSKDFCAPGIGAGQMSRIDAVKIAAQKMQQMGFSTEQAYMASDAFFPFRDAIDQAAKYSIRAIIQPGGSMRDAEVIEAANECGIIMLCTGVRHFYH